MTTNLAVYNATKFAVYNIMNIADMTTNVAVDNASDIT